MKTVEFTILGEPIGKARPRFTRTGHAYTPDKTRKYEQAVEDAYNNVTDRYMFDGAVYLRIDAYFKIAKKTKLRLPTKKPDIDNIAKIIMDGLNKVAWKDDTQVIKLRVNKCWSNEPRVEVKIEEVVE